MVCPLASFKFLTMPGKRAPAVETLARADTDKARTKLALRIPVPKQRHKFLKLHFGPMLEKREHVFIGDRHCRWLTYPVVFTPRLPTCPLRFEVRHGVTQRNRQTYPVGFNPVSVQIVHLLDMVNRQFVLAFEIDTQHADFALTALCFLHDQM